MKTFGNIFHRHVFIKKFYFFNLISYIGLHFMLKLKTYYGGRSLHIEPSNGSWQTFPCMARDQRILILVETYKLKIKSIKYNHTLYVNMVSNCSISWEVIFTNSNWSITMDKFRKNFSSNTLSPHNPNI